MCKRRVLPSNGASHGLLGRAGVLSIALVVGMQMAGLPAVPAMVRHYEELPRAFVENLVTVQSASAMVMVLLSSQVVGAFGERRTVLAGLLVSGVAGLIPALTDCYVVILASRIAFGLGIGVLSPLAISMVVERFEGDERAKMLGARSAVETLGMAISTPLAGLLLSWGWRASYLVYVFIGVPLALFYKGVPESQAVVVVRRIERRRRIRLVSEPGEPCAINVSVMAIVLLNVCMTVAYAGFELRVSSIVETREYGSAVFSGVAVSMLALSASCAGALYGRVYAWLGDKTGAVGLLLMAVGIFIGAMAHSLPVFIAGIVISGASFSIVMSYYSGAVSDVCPMGRGQFCTSLFVAGGFVGSFVSPWALAGIESLQGVESASLSLVPLCGVLAILGCAAYVRCDRTVARTWG